MGHSSINYQDPHTWTSFGGSPPEILFFGVDPVAIDSVMTDYLNRENSARSESLRKDNILVYAASIGLGVFEHWDGSTTRNYSGTGINYVEIDNDTGLCKNCMGDPAADLTVTEGTAVNIVIKGISCGGKTVTMEYHEIDRGSKQQITGNYNLPATAEFSNDTAAVSWTAEWFDDVDGYDADPEIQFTAVCGSSSRISSTLKVVKAGGGK
jgi:hypothetical protein